MESMDDRAILMTRYRCLDLRLQLRLQFVDSTHQAVSQLAMKIRVPVLTPPVFRTPASRVHHTDNEDLPAFRALVQVEQFAFAVNSHLRGHASNVLIQHHCQLCPHLRHLGFLLK